MNKNSTFQNCRTYLISLAFLLNSCTSYNFSVPQPVDENNLYAFPKRFRGTWVTDGDTVVIGRGFFLMPKHDPRKISVASKKVIKRHAQMGFGMTIPIDSSKGKSLTETASPIRYIEAVDTSCHFLISNGKVYEIEKNQLSSGFLFSQKGDTIYYTNVERTPLLLCQNLFLRKISLNQFLLNMREEKESWWTIALLEITPDGFILVRGLGEKFNQNAPKIYSHGDSFYFDSKFTRERWLNLLSKGVFSEEHIKLKIKDKIKSQRPRSSNAKRPTR